MNITVLGDGAWGTAIANLLAENGYHISLWCYNKETYESISSTKVNNIYLKGVKLSDKICPYLDLRDSISQSDVIFEAIPVRFLRNIINLAKDYLINKNLVLLSKGIENNTLYFPSQIVNDVIKNKNIDIAVLSGPSFAIDLANKQFTGVVLASSNKNLLFKLQKILDNNYFKTELSDDLKGVEFCGAYKNIVALLIGILDGMNFADNTKAYFIVKTLKDMGYIIEFLGARIETLYGLSGVGDLILTATSVKSKNFLLGQKIGKLNLLNKNFQINQLIETYSTVEGPNTLFSIYNLLNKYNLKIDTIEKLYSLIFKQEYIDFLNFG